MRTQCLGSIGRPNAHFAPGDARLNTKRTEKVTRVVGENHFSVRVRRPISFRRPVYLPEPNRPRNERTTATQTVPPAGRRRLYDELPSRFPKTISGPTDVIGQLQVRTHGPALSEHRRASVSERNGPSRGNCWRIYAKRPVIIGDGGGG